LDIIVVLMDPIGSISIKKDSTFAMLLEAQRPRASCCRSPGPSAAYRFADGRALCPHATAVQVAR
jgi:hypothetical protein